MRILERENYYNVINGYKELFLASKATATADEAYTTLVPVTRYFRICRRNAGNNLTDNPQLPEMAAVFFNKVLAIYRLPYF